MPRRYTQVNPHQPPRHQHRLPVLLLHQPPHSCITGPISSGCAPGSNPTATVPGRQSPATAPTHVLQPGQTPAGAGPLPSYGSSVARPAVAIKSARPGTTPASEPKSSPPTGPAGDAMQPWLSSTPSNSPISGTGSLPSRRGPV